MRHTRYATVAQQAEAASLNLASVRVQIPTVAPVERFPGRRELINSVELRMDNGPYASGDATGLSPLAGRIVTDMVYHLSRDSLPRLHTVDSLGEARGRMNWTYYGLVLRAARLPCKEAQRVQLPTGPPIDITRDAGGSGIPSAKR